MPTDHPDGTFPVALIMADIMMPVDIQAQYVTLDVDITAQTIGNLAIDIAAQSVGHLDINIAASAVTLDINVASQDADIDVNIAASAVTLTVTVSGTADIDITAQSVGVFIESEWAASQGQQKRWRAFGDNKARGSGVLLSYTVPGGKTLYLSCFTGASSSQDAADGDANQICHGMIEIASAWVLEIGGNGGFAITFPCPLVVAAGELVSGYIDNFANHNCDLWVTLVGFEV